MSFEEFGIDISKYESGINLGRAKEEGVRFAILRGAFHLTEDVEFRTFYREAKEKQLDVGVYLYTMAENTTQAREEADFLIDTVLKDKQFELPIYMDIEDEIFMSKSREENTAIVRAFCDRMEEADYFTGFYASKYFIDTYLNDDDLKAYTHWVAQWSTECTYTDRSVLGMWQFGGSTNEIRSRYIAGYVCDQDYMYQDFPAIIKGHGFNGF